MLDRIWSHPKVSDGAKAAAQFLVRGCLRDQSWVVIAKEVTRILDGEIDTPEERKEKVTPSLDPVQFARSQGDAMARQMGEQKWRERPSKLGCARSQMRNTCVGWS